MPWIYDRYHWIIITPKLQTFSLKKWMPYGTGDNDDKEFFIFNAYCPLSV